jgi:hypothetical protein
MHGGRRAWLASVFAGCVVIICGCRGSTPPPAGQYGDDWTGLFLAVTKSFGARTYYTGSDDSWSYFQTDFEKSILTPTCRKVRTSSMKLRRTFPIGQGARYVVELSDFYCDNGCRPL